MRKFIVILVLSCASLAHAAGGACPSGSNYVNPSAPTGALVTASTIGCVAAYYIADAGSDTNTGQDETHPFHFAPGMTNCASNCATASTTAGTWFIFKGGDQWNFGNTGATNYIGAHTWTFSNSGSSSAARMYIGIDPTWFSGGSFARPLFNGDNLITTSRPSSCSAFDSNNVATVSLGNDAHIIFDGIEFSGYCATEVSDPNSGNIVAGGTDAVIMRSYWHGFTVPSTCGTSCFDEQTAIHGTSGAGAYIGDLTNQCLYNVFDNTDGTLGNVAAAGGGTSSGDATLEAIQVGCAVVAYSVFARLSNGLVGISTTMHDNLFFDLYESGISTVHGNIWNVDNDSAFNNGTQTFYNNKTFNINEGVGVWFMPTQSGVPLYYFNNVSWSIGNSANCFMIGGTSQSSGLPTGSQIFETNNTWDSPCNTRALNNGSDPKWNGTTFFQNGHYIGYGTPGTLANLHSQDSGTVATWTDNGNEIFQTEATANGQGYTAANAYAPTTSNGSSVGAGSNLTASCSTYSPDSALCKGFASVTEQSGWGGQIAVYNTPVARPSSGAWDSGAYEYSGTTTPPGAPAAPWFAKAVVSQVLSNLGFGN